MNYLSANIRYLRRKSGQNQAELALNFGKKQNTVGNWENGVSEPSIKELVSLSQIFMVGMEDLVNRNLEHGSSLETVEGEPANSQNGPSGAGGLSDTRGVSAQDKEMEGFWLTLRELRKMNEKLDILIARQS